VLNEGTTRRVAFLTYYKAQYEIHSLDLKEPLHTVASADFGEPGRLWIPGAGAAHPRPRKGAQEKAFEKMFLEGGRR